MRIALVGAECEENLALRYIRAALEQQGHEVTQLAFNSRSDTETCARKLAGSGADLAGFSMVFTYRSREFANLATRTRELGFGGHMVAGGHFAAFNADSLLLDVPAFDSVAVGEGEQIMCDLAGHLGHLRIVRGLIWRDAFGMIHRNPHAEKPPSLDQLPRPVRLKPPDAFLGLPVANVLASRGCSHACSFCSIAAWHKLCGGERFRLRDPAAVADEVADLYQSGYRIFNFHDDNFFLEDKDQTWRRLWRLRGRLEERGVGWIAFAIKSRPDTVDQDMFRFLKEFGLFRVFLGVEAGTLDSLRRLGRGLAPTENERALEILHRLELHTCFNLLLLNPDSTLEDFQANVAFLRAHAANPMNFCRTEVYAGTPLEARLRREGRLQGNYWGYSYHIRDERAQEAFELIREGLAGRHDGDGCLHHLAMRIDFERQILDHFWDCPPGLCRQVKDLVRGINLNSCDYLDDIARSAATGFVSRAGKEAYLRDLARRARCDNERFALEAAEVLTEIQRRIAPRTMAHTSWQREAAAVLVSSLVLAPGAASPAQIAAVQPAPPSATSSGRRSGSQDEQRLRLRLGTAVGQAMVSDLGRPADVDLVLWVNAEGRLRKSSLVRVDLREQTRALGEEERGKAVRLLQQAATGSDLEWRKAAEDLKKMGTGALPELRQAVGSTRQAEALKRLGELEDVLEGARRVPSTANLRLALSTAEPLEACWRGQCVVLRYTAAELNAYQRIKTPPTHIFEMAPLPPDHDGNRK